MTGGPTVFLLHGFLGVGKTTMARRLEAAESALRFTHDEWMARLYGTDPPEAAFADYAGRVSDLMETIWTRCVSLGTNVVLDFGFWSRSERECTRQLVELLGGRAVLYRLSCPDEVAWTRIAARNDMLEGSLHIAPNTYRLLKARFEPLTPDEERVEVQSGAERIA